MFDVSFSELVLILIVGLVVFGPEKLPEVVRTVGLWLSKLRRSFNHIRSEIEREVGMDELKRDIHNQGIMDSLKEVHNDLRSDLHKVQQELNQIPHDIQNAADHNQHSTVPMEPFPTETAPTSASNELANNAPAREPLAEPEHFHRPS